MLDKVMQLVGPAIGSGAMTVKRNQPALALVGGIGLGIAGAIALARAHKESQTLFYEYEDEKGAMDDALDEIEIASDEDPESEPVRFTKMDRAKAMVPVHAMFAAKFARLYGPAILLGAGSITLLVAGHRIQGKRIASLVSTAVVLEKSFAQYRARVVDELGAESDERFMYGGESRRTTVLEHDGEGKAKKRKKDKNHIPEILSPAMYGRLFDETNHLYTGDADRNEFLLRAVEDQMNTKLVLNGHVLLNDVYEALGFQRTSYGAVVGWSTKGKGDERIDLGLDLDINNREGEPRWIIDPNVHGVMVDQI